MPRFLHRDRDAIYGDTVRKRIRSIGMEEVVSAKQSPWQNPYAERVIGSIRRECTDHLIPIDEAHLRRILGEYVACYNRARWHQSLDGNAPEPRQVEDGDGPCTPFHTLADFTTVTPARADLRADTPSDSLDRGNTAR